MKKLLIILSVAGLGLANNSYAQKLTGTFTETRCLLWNEENGAKYTYNNQPFTPSMQLAFNDKKNEVVVTVDGYSSTKTYEMEGDTLVLKEDMGKGENKRTLIEKYLLNQTSEGLLLFECKPNANKNTYVKRHNFRRGGWPSDYKPEKHEDYFTIVESMPEYPGGTPGLMKFIAEEVAKSPINTKQTVYVKMLINPQGKIQNADIINVTAVGLNYAEEAMKIVRKMADFTPGTQNGKAVYVYYNIPIRFVAK